MCGERTSRRKDFYRKCAHRLKYSYQIKAVIMSEKNIPVIIVFGRPGAGKSTIAEAADKLLKEKNIEEIITLDLDVCIPQWMKDNFTKGIYPTPIQRKTFAGAACDYVRDQINNRVGSYVLC